MSDGIQHCPICRLNKNEVTSLKTYNGTYTLACPKCKTEMNITLQLMAASANLVLNKSKTLARSTNKFVLTPLLSTG